jgi:hypothetical protein
MHHRVIGSLNPNSVIARAMLARLGLELVRESDAVDLEARFN